jgi:hypothetical protein
MDDDLGGEIGNVRGFEREDERRRDREARREE